MPQPASNLRAYKGPAILAALAVTLIAALAIPRATSVNRSEEPADITVASTWNATIKRADVLVGGYVAKGNTILVLSDPELDKELTALEDQLKLAMLETKQAVAEPGIFGMIGSVPKVVWEIPKGTIQPKQPVAKVVERPDEVTPLVKEEGNLDSKLMQASQSLNATESELKEAATAVTQAETDVNSAQETHQISSAATERMQKLFDMGAIPKKKLDAAIADSDQTSQQVEQAKNKLEAAKAHQEDLERQLSDLRSQLTKLQAQLKELRVSLDAAKEKAKSASAPAPSKPSAPPEPPKPIRKLVYGSAPESNAPVQVKLVETEDPTQDKRIEELRTKILELRKRQEALKVIAPIAGRVTWLPEPGAKVTIGGQVAVIKPSR